MDDKSRDSIEEIIIDDGDLGSDLDDDEPLMTMNDLGDDFRGQGPKRRSIHERKGTPFKRVTFACDVDDYCGDDGEDMEDTSQDQVKCCQYTGGSSVRDAHPSPSIFVHFHAVFVKKYVP